MCSILPPVSSRYALGLWSWTALIATLLWWLFSWTAGAQRARRRSSISESQPYTGPTLGGKAFLDDLEQVQKLYYQLHHLESFPCAVHTSLDVLRHAFDRAVAKSSLSEEKCYNILDITGYSRTSLTAWIKGRDRTSTQSFQAYTARRAAGGPRELIKTRSAAKTYFQAQAPLRYVDGAWLGRVSRARAPWKDQKIMQLLWQTLSEELGDGDLTKHHTHIYRELLLSLEPQMPAGNSKEFSQRQWGADDEHVWISGLVQLMIALFQDDFLPELLGFNLHFEGITPGMMVASVETREIGLDPIYFLLHIAIDNAHSGHTAMALDAVCDYVEQCRDEEGPRMAERAWRRIQAGYLLSEGRWNPSKQSRELSASSQNELRVADLFSQKAEAGCDVHCTSKTMLGGRRIIDWLKPPLMADHTWRTALVRNLGETRYWITPGKSSNSRFMRELLWPGRMFGAFTDTECKLVERWIQELSEPCDGAYITFIGPEERVPSALSTNTRMTRIPNLERIWLIGEGDFEEAADRPFQISKDILDAGAITNSPVLPALWFAHLCLLEGFTAVPSRCANANAQSAIRMLRAQNGLSQPTHSVIGNSNCSETTEHQDCNSLIDIGLQLLTSRGLVQTRSLGELLNTYPSNSLVDVVMDISAAPYMRPELVLGMASSFAALYRAVAQSVLLDPACCQQLFEVAAVHDREAVWFLHEHDREATNSTDFIKGATYVRQALEQMERAC